MKVLVMLFAISLNLSAMYNPTCEENDAYHISIQGLKKEDILQAFLHSLN